MVIPFRYKKLGFEVYNTEIGWSRGASIFADMIGVQCDNGKWGVMRTSGQMVASCTYDRVLYNGVFYRGHTNLVPGMNRCRSDAAARKVQVVGFVVVGGRAVGYVDTTQTLRLLSSP